MIPEIETCYKILAEVQDTIRRIEENCEHPDPTLFKVMDANTGNWCPQDDCYWADFRCYQCGKRWRADSEKDSHDYRFRGIKVREFPTENFSPPVTKDRPAEPGEYETYDRHY